MENDWANLGVNLAVTTLVAFILLKAEKRLANKWSVKHDDINSRYVHVVPE